MTRRSLPPLTALRAFEAFARLGKMTTAADELCVTHGAISRQIRSLEESVGLALTEGPRHRLKLTDAGERLAASLSGAFDRVERTLADLKSAGDTELHLSCLGTFAMRWLIPRLGSFHEQHPGLRVRVTESFAPADFARERYDAAIRLTEHVPAHGGEAIAFLDNFHGPVAAPQLTGATPGVKAFASLPRLHTRPHLQAWAEWESHTGTSLPEAAQNREFEHLFYMLEAAVAGLGVGLSPFVYVAADIEAGRLAAPVGFVRTPAQFYLILPPGPARPAASAFRNWLLDEAAKVPAPI
ncbi:MAG: LysR family transcriptional regulator [Phenylobacterium sp.]|nr:LysR family transcriptional regulator [Phenylobacterium sp.]MBP8245456.1 LysR family transcriptional regulator [Phenylobacterium sp.]